MKPLALAVPSVLAACFALTSLTACTIYTYDSPPPKARPSKTRPTKTTTAKPSRGGIIKGSGSSTTTTTTGGRTSGTPTVKGSTIFGSGTVGAFRGEAFVIPEGTKVMPNFDDMVPFGVLYKDQFDVSPQEFSGGFPGALSQDEWFGIRYVGKIAIPARGTVTFKLVSDDGAVLYIDDTKVLDNDGVHTAKTATADVSLAAGQHALRLEYFQEKKGNVALQLFLVAAGQDIPVVGVR